MIDRDEIQWIRGESCESESNINKVVKRTYCRLLQWLFTVASLFKITCQRYSLFQYRYKDLLITRTVMQIPQENFTATLGRTQLCKHCHSITNMGLFSVKSLALKWCHLFFLGGMTVFVEYFNLYMKQFGLNTSQIGFTTLFGLLQLTVPIGTLSNTFSP